ncbi:MAG: tRNA 5-methoxyuridine(34)/uridine 5-oxyacetic acid(34) synthase CmoB [Oligoflexales bacterium]|nr:tRNA 5-methoxyuridine(34)/uridine 5-oxyacetic acid(34) synthase CmoB [Oligoflexales bacterium]
MEYLVEDSWLKSAFAEPEYFSQDSKMLETSKIMAVRRDRSMGLMSAGHKKFRDGLIRGMEIQRESPPVLLGDRTVRIGNFGDLSQDERRILDEALRAFIPWKKGPFEIYGRYIDAEWQSDLKWERLLPYVGTLSGERVADLGCNNGYYMFRMAAMQPEFVIGFEPYEKYWFNFALLRHLTGIRKMHFELLGVEHIHYYKHFFNTVFCLGILYHHHDPISLLSKIKKSLANKGRVIIDCQGIPGDEPYALTPSGRYAGARGIWFLPTLNCLKNWLRRADFRNVDIIYSAPLQTTEQRSTEWAPIRSLGEFLMPSDSTRTVEGYPAPYRFYVGAS